MSDFKNISDFKKSKLSKYPYQDPTYLSFVILFDFYDRVNSPLLSKETEEYLEKLAESNSAYQERLEALINFKQALATINNAMPWYWQSISGLDRIQKYIPESNYWGGEDAVLKIETLESINLTISGLMHLYKKAVFDENKWNYIVPVNLRKFRMYVYVTEIRTIKNMTKPVINGIPKNVDFDAIKGFPGNMKPELGIENSNDGISGQSARPFFMFGLKYCEFDLKSGAEVFATLSKNPDGAATGELSINYQALEKVQARVLNGIVKDSVNNSDVLSPAPDSENYSADSLKDFMDDKINDKLKEVQGNVEGAIGDLARSKADEAIQRARDATINRIPSIDNVFQNMVQGIDNATNLNNQSRSIGNAIQANVNDNILPSGSARQALDAAAERALGNVFD